MDPKTTSNLQIQMIQRGNPFTRGQISLSRMLTAVAIIGVALFVFNLASSEQHNYRGRGPSAVRISTSAVALAWLAISLVSAAIGMLFYGWKGFGSTFALVLVVPPLSIYLLDTITRIR